MAYETRDMSGSAFKNRYKDSDNKPTYTGTCKIGDVEYKQAIWVKVDKNGNKWLSFSYSIVDQNVQSSSGRNGSNASQVVEDIDDDIPF